MELEISFNNCDIVDLIDIKCFDNQFIKQISELIDVEYNQSLVYSLYNNILYYIKKKQTSKLIDDITLYNNKGENFNFKFLFNNNNLKLTKELSIKSGF